MRSTHEKLAISGSTQRWQISRGNAQTAVLDQCTHAHFKCPNNLVTHLGPKVRENIIYLPETILSVHNLWVSMQYTRVFIVKYIMQHHVSSSGALLSHSHSSFSRLMKTQIIREQKKWKTKSRSKWLSIIRVWWQTPVLRTWNKSKRCGAIATSCPLLLGQMCIALEFGELTCRTFGGSHSNAFCCPCLWLLHQKSVGQQNATKTKQREPLETWKTFVWIGKARNEMRAKVNEGPTERKSKGWKRVQTTAGDTASLLVRKRKIENKNSADACKFENN